MRPQALQGATYKRLTGCGNMYITLNCHEGIPYEVFMIMGKAGGCASAQCEGIGRLATALLKQGAKNIDIIIQQLQGISCHTSNGDLPSCANALAQVLKEVSFAGAADASELSCAKATDTHEVVVQEEN